jgi:thioredoxin 1
VYEFVNRRQEMAAETRVQVATEANFGDLVLTSQIPVIVDFWAPWCVWCKKLAPIYDAVSATMDGLKFVKANVDDERKLAEEYGISSLPTLKFFCGGREIGELVGALPKDKLETKFKEVVAGHKECLAASSPTKRS